MDICIITDTSNVENKFEQLETSMKECFNKINAVKSVRSTSIEQLETHKKCDMFIVISNNYNFVKQTAEVLKGNNRAIIHVTSNLSPNHVIDSLKYVSDICYAKAEIGELVGRLLVSYNRHNAMKKLGEEKV